MVVLALPLPILVIISFRYSNFFIIFLRNTYLFWAVFSLSNLYLLAPFLFPTLYFVELAEYNQKFSPFLLAPIGLSFAIAGVLTLALTLALPVVYKSRAGKEIVSLFFNAIFLIIFVIAADHHKEKYINNALAIHQPDCVQINSFFNSIFKSGKEFQLTPHAIFTENGKTYFWSYSELKFFEGKEALSKNFECLPLIKEAVFPIGLNKK